MLNVLEPPPAAAMSSDALKLDVEGKLNLTVRDFTGQRVAVLGSPGMGKSNTSARLVEQLRPRIPFDIFDIHNEYYGLAERFEFLRVGRGKDDGSPPIHIEAGPAQAAAIAEYAFENQLSVIVQMLYMSEDERLDFTHRYCQRLWELNLIPKRPRAVLLEEAHNFVPQVMGNSPVLKQMSQFASEGRKFGFTVILSTQRTAKINKDILADCNIAFLHGVNIHNDFQAYSGMLPYSVAETKKIVMAMGTGEALVRIRSEGPPRFEQVKMLLRETQHVGHTPGVDAAPAIQLRMTDGKLVEALQKLLTPKPSPPTPLPQGEGRKTAGKNEAENVQIADLQKQLKAKDAEIERLKGEIAALKNNPRPQLPTDRARPVPTTQRGEQDKGAVRVAAAPIVHPDDEWDGKSPLATARAKAKQQRDFEGLLLTIRDQKVMHRRILVYLTRREEQAFSENDLARYLGYSRTSITHSYPNDLVNRGLIRRGLTVDKLQYTFQSTVREKLAELCPDLEIEPLVERINKLERV